MGPPRASHWFIVDNHLYIRKDTSITSFSSIISMFRYRQARIPVAGVPNAETQLQFRSQHHARLRCEQFNVGLIPFLWFVEINLIFYRHPSNISLSKDAPEPRLADDQVMVDVYSAGLNFFDVC